MWLYSITSICLLCLNVGSALRCDGTTDCRCCVDENCGVVGNYRYDCYNGCIDGYRGQQCYVRCPETCKACTRSNPANCTKCPDGYFLGKNKDCRGTCPANCNTCNSTSYCSECKEGFNNEGKMGVCRSCPTNCVCKNSTCVACKDGFYDTSVTCENKCPVNCASCVSNEMCIKCKDGYYNGFKFDIPENEKSETCGHQCRNSCVTCTSYNYCVQCILGRHGSTCESVCSEGCVARNCSRETGRCNCLQNFTGVNCSDCIDGKYGTLCSILCPVNCQNSLCEKESGNCSKGCIRDTFVDGKCNECAKGMFGELCDEPCPNNCRNNKCDRNSRECVDGCVGTFDGTTCEDCISGKYGFDCKSDCSERCKGDNCTKMFGHCFTCIENFSGSKCKDCSFGFYGLNCEAKCSEHCSNGTCDRYTGECDGGCKGNYTGDKCCVENGKCLKCDTNTQCNVCLAGFFGLSCENECPVGCVDSCNFTSGICDACKTDVYGLFCDEECSKTCIKISTSISRCDQSSGQCVAGCTTGTFGPTCNKTCSDYCIDNECDRYSGACEKGCKSGYDASVCHVNLGQKHPEHQSRDNIRTILVVVVVVVAVVAILISVLVIVWVIRKRKQRKEPGSKYGTIARQELLSNRPVYENIENQEFSLYARSQKVADNGHTSDETTLVDPDDVKQENYSETALIKDKVKQNSSLRTESYGTCDEGGEPKYNNVTGRRINVACLLKYVAETNRTVFEKQFETLPKDLTMPCMVAKRPGNIALNRFNSIYPYDHSRVTIRNQPGFFINACYIDSYKGNKGYIASLGPTAKTTDGFAKFWQMVWNEKSNVIIMLTRLREVTGMKCEEYWPKLDTTNVYGDIIVTCRSVEEFAEYTVRTFTLIKADEKSRHLHQLHFTAWPDKGVPDDVTSLIEFRQRVKAVPAVLKGPQIIHCSAGIGRTGTYIALDRLTEEGRSKGYVDVVGCVTKMRQQRVNMVQTLEQYIFLHQCLVHSLILDSEYLTAEEIQQYVQTTTDTTFSGKFQKLQQRVETENREDNDTRQTNVRRHKDKNRPGADVPGDRNRVRLHVNRTSDNFDYINAVYVNSFKVKNYFIVAQSPLPSTVEDFVAMIYQENCSCIVSLEDNESRRKDVGKYLPVDNRPLNVGDFILTSTECETEKQYHVKTITIQNNGRHNTGVKTTRSFQYTGWGTDKKTPDNVEEFVDFIRDVVKCASSETAETNVLVHCLNGSARSGLFCTVATLLEKLDIERRVNVENTVRKIRTKRRLAIPNMEQFKFCYQCLSVHLEMYKTYTNFVM